MERIVTARPTDDEIELDLTLRPKIMGEFIGQEKMKENLYIFIQAAKNRGEPLDHVLLSGPPGLGKTTLAGIIANELGVNFRSTSGPAIERAGDIAATFTTLEQKGVLFIDEIHRLHRSVEEILYPAMEEYQLDLVIGKGASARSLKLELPYFTLIGATTRTGLITSPLRDRFGINIRLDFYPEEDIEEIVNRSSRILNVEIDHIGSKEIARRARGTPRVANRLLKRVRDFAEVKADGLINGKIACEALEFMEIDEMGLDKWDKNILLTLIDKFKGRPVGLGTLSTAVGEEKETIEDVYEPYLLQIGFLERTSRGRLATERAYDHLGIKKKEDRLF